MLYANPGAGDALVSFDKRYENYIDGRWQPPADGRAHRVGRAIEAGRVWVNCYHQYPAHATFGGYKRSGIGRETHKQALEHYQQTKCQLVSYADNPMGLF